MGLFDFLKHPPYQAQIADAAMIKSEYRYWRIRIFLSMYFGYAFFYLSRKSFTFAMPAMMDSLGFTKSDLGIISSVLYITYGLSKFVSGIMSDRSNPRYFMGMGLIITGVLNILFGMASSLLFFAVIWGLNGWFQGWGWPPCARLLTHWYSQKERGTWWGLCSTSHNVGGAIIPLLVAYLISVSDWRTSMMVPGLICIVGGLIVISRLRDTPESLGLPPIEKYKSMGKVDENISEVRAPEAELTRRQLVMDYVLKNRYIWILAFAYFFVYVVRTAVNDWGQLYLYEHKGFTIMEAGSCIFSFEIGGLFGCLIAGTISDVVFHGRRGPVNAIFSLLVMLSVIALWYAPSYGLIATAVVMFMVGFLVFGPQMLIGLTAAEVSHKKAAGSATGFIGWFAYSGAAAAGYPLGKITHEWGWELFFFVLTLCALISVLLLFPLWTVKGREQAPAVAEPQVTA